MKKNKKENRMIKFYPNYQLIAKLAGELAEKAMLLKAEAEKPAPNFNNVLGINDFEILPLALLIDKSIIKDNSLSINKAKSDIRVSHTHIPVNVAKRKPE